MSETVCGLKACQCCREWRIELKTKRAQVRGVVRVIDGQIRGIAKLLEGKTDTHYMNQLGAYKNVIAIMQSHGLIEPEATAQ